MATGQGRDGRPPIEEIAQALGVSKTTVSRALSGKGRVSEETRAKVFAYVGRPGVDSSTPVRRQDPGATHNLSLVIPKHFMQLDLPFLRKCMGGVCTMAAQRGYDLLLCYVSDTDTVQLERQLASHKVDGVILSRTMSDDPSIDLLQQYGVPFATTFRMLCGLSRPTSGQCSVDGVDLLRAGSAARSRLGYMAQKFSLYLDIPVRENILTCAELYGLAPERRKALLPVLAQALELTDFLDSRTHSLPLGQKQRLALLCATLHEPPVLFLDEPTSGVDARTRRDFWKHITAMTEAGASVLVTTHFMEEAEYCDRMALIYRGAMISMGTPDELKASCRGLPGVPEDPTLEDAFIASIRRYDAEHPQ